MGGREEIDRGTRRKGAPPRLGARVPFDFAIFIGEIEHNVDARSVGVRVDRWTPPSLPSAILDDGKGKRD